MFRNLKAVIKYQFPFINLLHLAKIQKKKKKEKSKLFFNLFVPGEKGRRGEFNFEQQRKKYLQKI